MIDTEQPTRQEVASRAKFCLTQAIDYLNRDNLEFTLYWLREARLEVTIMVNSNKMDERKPE